MHHQSFLVGKKDNFLRLCVDFRLLNSKTHKEAFPLPRNEESFDALSGTKLFSTMDLTSGYNQIAMSDNDMGKLHLLLPWDCINMCACLSEFVMRRLHFRG